MKRSPRIGRRRFLGRTAAAVGAVAASSGLLAAARPSFAWRSSGAFPDGPATLEVRFEDPELTGWVHLSLLITTPREVLTEDLGRHRIRGGAATIEARLTYPYDDHVRGPYRYAVRVTLADGAIATSPVTGYEIRRRVPFV